MMATPDLLQGILITTHKFTTAHDYIMGDRASQEPSMTIKEPAPFFFI